MQLAFHIHTADSGTLRVQCGLQENRRPGCHSDG